MTDAGSEFQTDGVAHLKERFVKSVRANGWMSSGVAVERSVRVDVAVNALADVPWHRRVQSLVCQYMYTLRVQLPSRSYRVFYVIPLYVRITVLYYAAITI